MSGILGFITSFPTLLHSAVIFGTVIMFGAMGEILAEKAGNLNLGVPGIMYLGGIAGLIATFMYENVYCVNAGIEPNVAICIVLGLVSAFAAAALGGLIFSFLTITLRTNQNVTGLTLTIFGSGIGNFFGGSLNKLAGGVGQVTVTTTSEAFRAYFNGLVEKLDAVTGSLNLGTLLFSYGFLTYVAIIMAVLLWYFLSKTRAGLSLRAVGENTGTADAAGINVTKYKYLATCIGGGISGWVAAITSWSISAAPGKTRGRSRPWAGWPWRWSSLPPGSRCAISGARTSSVRFIGPISISQA